MRDHPWNTPRHLTIRVTRRDDPVSAVTEQDACRAAVRYPSIVIRGPVFGYAEQRPEDAPAWRLLSDVADGYPQHSRDGLISHLWTKAQTETRPGDRLRAHLMAAIARLQREPPANELTAGTTRYRVVRADEFARIGPDGIEGPRPTDPDDPRRDIGAPGRRPSCRTTGFLIDHARATGIAESIQRMELLALRYRSPRIPRAAREDSHRAVRTHPGVVLLPAAFTFAERKGTSWEPMAGLLPTPQDARAVLFSYLTEFLPALERDVPHEHARRYAAAAEAYRSGPPRDELRVLGRRFRVIRVERMMRIGPDGPEPPRPSDLDPYGPTQLDPYPGAPPAPPAGG